MPHILTIPRHQAPKLPVSGCITTDVLDFLHPPLWQARANVEHDERYLQAVVYLLLFNTAGQVWCYQRVGGDARLDGRCSCGVGGHVDQQDAQDAQDASQPFNAVTTLHQTLLRELGEELQMTPADLRDVRLCGLIYEGLSAVGRVHLGVLYTAVWCGAHDPEPQPNEKLASLGFVDLEDICAQPRFELWSRLAAQYLLQHAP